MFCSECGTKVNEGAKFCFNCGAKIIGTEPEMNKISKVEKEIPEEFVYYIESKYIELYVEGKKITPDVFYKKAKFYEVVDSQVDRVVSEYESKISKLEKFIDSVYEECTLFELDENEEEEIINFGNSLGFDDEDIEELMSNYDEQNHIEEKQELYSECVLNYISDGKTNIKRSDKVEEYQEEVYKVFEKNILQMESLLKKQYEKAKEYELSQEQLDLIYSEGEKWFPDEAIVGIIYSYDKKSGVLEVKEEKERQRALERMTIFELYGEQVAYTEEECTGINIGKSYRKIFQRINNEFLAFYDNTDRTKEGYWDEVNNKVLFLIDTVYKAMCSTLEKRGISQEEISSINYMDVFKYWIPIFEDVDYKYNVICSGTEAAEYYRKIRKATRGRLVGGGFGLDGAIKGIATAGAINMMTGAAHSAFNFVGNIKSEWKKLQSIKELFGYSLKEKITVVFQKTIQLVYITELAVLEKYGVKSTEFQLFYGDETISKAGVKVEEIKNSPFNVQLYEIAIKTLGDNQKQLEKIADFAGIDVTKIKENYVNEKFANVELDENNAQKIFESIQKTKTELGYSKRSEVENKLGRIKKEMDEEKICVYDVELFCDMRGSFVKPKLVNGTKWIYRDNDKLLEMRQKREEFVSAYNSMKTSEIKSMGETLDILEAISSQYGIGKSVVKNLNAYILTKIVTSEMYLDRNGYIKVEQIGIFQCTSVNEYLRVCKMRYQIKEKYEYNSVSSYNAYEVYKDIKSIVGEEAWGKKLLRQIHSKIDWKYLFEKGMKAETVSEMYNDLIEGEIIQDIPELLLKEGKYSLEIQEGDKVHYADRNQALEVLKFNKFTEIVVSTIRTSDVSDYIKKAQVIIDNKPKFLKNEKIVVYFKNKILEFQEELIKAEEKRAELRKATSENLCNAKGSEEDLAELKEQGEDWRELYELAVLYEESDSEKRDIASAVEIYKELAETGISVAQWRLGKCYNSGDGVEKDQKKAFELFTKAAEQECVEAISALGTFYSSLFTYPSEKNDQYAVELFIKAAKEGCLPAQCNLAIHFYKGLGVKENKSQAIYWWTEAAKQGSAIAQYNLGQRYEYGEGVEKSKEKALYWYDVASKQGYKKAIDSAKKLRGGCYITTAVCKSFGKADNCYELQTFRKFRDEWLIAQSNGKVLIDEYYHTAPIIVEKIDAKEDARKIYEQIWEKYLKNCLEYIENEQFEECRDLYIEMVNTMKSKYFE